MTYVHHIIEYIKLLSWDKSSEFGTYIYVSVAMFSILSGPFVSKYFFQYFCELLTRLWIVEIFRNYLHVLIYQIHNSWIHKTCQGIHRVRGSFFFERCCMLSTMTSFPQLLLIDTPRICELSVVVFTTVWNYQIKHWYINSLGCISARARHSDLIQGQNQCSSFFTEGLILVCKQRFEYMFLQIDIRMSFYLGLLWNG